MHSKKHVCSAALLGGQQKFVQSYPVSSFTINILP